MAVPSGGRGGGGSSSSSSSSSSHSSRQRRIARRALPMTMGLLLSLPTAAVLGLKLRSTTHNPFVAPPGGPHPHGPWMMAPQRFLLPLPRSLAPAGPTSNSLVLPVASIISSSGSDRTPFARGGGGHTRQQRSGGGGGMAMVCTAAAAAGGMEGSSHGSSSAGAASSSGAGGSGNGNASAGGGWRGLFGAFRGGVGAAGAGAGAGAAASPSTSLRILSSSYAALSGAAPTALEKLEGGILSFLPPGIPTDVPHTNVATGADGGASPLRAGLAAAGGKRKKKVLILMSDTGGGHRASAQALEAAFDELFPNQVRLLLLRLIFSFRVVIACLLGSSVDVDWEGGSHNRTNTHHNSFIPPTHTHNNNYNNTTGGVLHRRHLDGLRALAVQPVRARLPVHGQEPLLLEGLLGVREVSSS